MSDRLLIYKRLLAGLKKDEDEAAAAVVRAFSGIAQPERKIKTNGHCCPECGTFIAETKDCTHEIINHMDGQP